MSIINYQNRLFALQTRHTSYVLALTESGLLEQIYWGRRIGRIEDFLGETGAGKSINVHGPQELREECSSFGGMRFKETSLKVTFADGVRDFRYRVEDCIVEGERLEIVLRDILKPFSVHLFYEVFPEEDIIRKWRTAVNEGEEDVILERFCSGEYGLPGSGYESINFKGRWGEEFHAFSEPVNSGKKVYESLCGLTAHTVSPFFLIHKGASETAGEAWYGALEYSGNFKTVVEAVNADYLNILIGISDTDFTWRLRGGERFETPAVYAGYSDAGFEKMSHTLHAFSRKYLMPREMADKVMPVLYNSWYSTTFDVKCEEQIRLAKKAAQMGVELFVVDDGWFAGRDDDTAGLGDWYADSRKFPGGLQELIDAVHKLGMKFGIWIEPEMVNPRSRLFEAHPDWILAYPGREVLMGRNQYELDMSNQAVVDYLIDIFDKLLTQNEIEYIKWDMNRYAAEVGSAAWLKEEWKELHFRNTMGVYRLIRELRARHPQVEFEACASGGGRVDYGAMRYFDEYWPSDNTDPLDRLFMQESYSYFYPIKYMRAWLTDDFGMNQRAIPLQFAMHCSMCGTLGIGIDLNAATEERRDQIASYIKAYKEVREVIQFGALYRLKSLQDGDIQAVQYGLGERQVVFLFLDHERYGRRHHTVKLRGLKEEQVYRYEADGQVFEKTGAFLMHHGLEVTLQGDYDSRMVVIREGK